MRQQTKILFFLILFIAGIFFIARGNDSIESQIVLNRQFFQKFMQTPSAIRDEFLEEKLFNRIVSGRGKIKSTIKTKRFKKNYCIYLNDAEMQRLNITISYHLYTSEKDIVSLATGDSLFEFSGQFIGATPLNTRRDSYIFDIILEKGALIVE